MNDKSNDEAMIPYYSQKQRMQQARASWIQTIDGFWLNHLDMLYNSILTVARILVLLVTYILGLPEKLCCRCVKPYI